MLKYSFWNIYLKYVRDDVMSTFIKAYDRDIESTFVLFFFLFLIMRPGHKATDEKT